MVHDTFDVVPNPPQTVKGVDGPILTYRVIGERDVVTSAGGPLVGRERELAYLQQSWARALQTSI